MCFILRKYIRKSDCEAFVITFDDSFLENSLTLNICFHVNTYYRSDPAMRFQNTTKFNYDKQVLWKECTESQCLKYLYRKIFYEYGERLF